MAPDTFLEFLKEYSQIEDFGYDQLICNDSYNFRTSSQKIDVDSEPFVEKINTVRVTHCVKAYAVVMDIINGNNTHRVSYSGDCRPSLEFAKVGENSDILIHEATFDDDMQGEAVAKKHCSIGEALEIGRL